MATFEINGVLHQLEENKGICIEAKTKHRILNKGDKDLEFILVSEPKSHADWVNIEENGGKHQYFAETLEWQHFFPTAFGNLNL